MRETLEKLKRKPHVLNTEAGDLLVLPLTIKQLRTAFRASKAFHEPEGLTPEITHEVAELLSAVLVDEDGKNCISPEQAIDLPLDVQMDIVVKTCEVVTKKKMS